MSEKDEILRQSGPLPNIPLPVIEAASSVQTQILVMLNDQNTQREQTNRIIFTKLDEASSLAREAAATASIAHDEVLGIKLQIDTKFRELNGSVGKSIDRLHKLELKDGERDALALQDAIRSKAVKAVTEGIWMMPKPTWQQLTVIGGVLAFIGADRVIAVTKMLLHLFDAVK